MSAENRRLNNELDEWFAAPKNAALEYVTVNQLLSEAISADRGRTQRAMQMIVAKLMKERGWLHERRMISGVRTWGFLKP